MITTKVGRRGQITLPSRIRRHIGLKEGDHIALLLENDRIIIHPITQTLLDLRGSVPVESAQDFESVRRQALDARASRNAQDES